MPITYISPGAAQYDPANLNNERSRGTNQRITEPTWFLRPFAGPNKDNYKGNVFWYMGQNKGDVSIEEAIADYVNKTGQIEKDLGVQKLGHSVPVKISLTNITHYVRNLCKNTDEAVSYLGTAYAGTRTKTIILSTDLITANVFTWTFTTTEVLTGIVSAETAVSQAFSVSHAATMALIIAQIEANSGIDAAGTGYSTDTITVVAKAGYVINTVVAPAVASGASQPTITGAETDTSELSTTISASAGAITSKSFGVAETEGLVVGMELNILTGNDTVGTMYEQVHIEGVSETSGAGIVYIEESFAQLPQDAATVMVIGHVVYGSGGNRLAPKIEVKLAGDDHSGLKRHEMFFYCIQVRHGKLSMTAEGEVAELDCLAIPKRTGSGSSARYKPYDSYTTNSIAGTI